MKETVSFEEAMEALKSLTEKIKAQDTSLEESLRCYEEGMKYYEICDRILSDAKQKIETFTSAR